jgi:hypothetical protein
MEDLVFYEMTCTNIVCEANDMQIRGIGPLETAFACGSCMHEITLWSVSEDQETKDGCVSFCPESELHVGWAQCYNSYLKKLSKES